MNDRKVLGHASASAHASAGGIGFTGLLTLVFITLKLVGVIHWPWIWVLSPLWISVLFIILVVVIFVLICKWLLK